MLRQFAKRVLPSCLIRVTERVRRTVRRLRFRADATRFAPYVISKRFDETQFKFLIGDACGREWYESAAIGNTQEMRFIRDRMIEPGDVILECGAHHGYTTLLLANWVGTRGRVLAFEPSHHNYRM